MKRYLSAILLILFGMQFVCAQVYNPIQVSGFNHDVVAEGDGNSSLATTTKEMDAIVPSNFVLCTRQFAEANAFQPANVYGLPDNGLFAVPGRSFQMAPFDQNNVLYLMGGESGILDLVQPARYTDFSLLALATEGDAQLNIRFQFSDGTTQTFIKTIEDWFNTIVPPTFSGYGRVKRKDGPILAGDYEAATQGNPRFRNLDLVLPCEKTLVSIEITNTAPAGTQSFRAFILAVSGLERKATPAVKISSNDSTACLGQPMRFVAKPDSGGNTPQFFWRINGGPVVGNDSVFVSSILNDGDTVTCTMKSSAFCPVPDTAISNAFIVRLKPLLNPEARVIAVDSLACEGDPVKFRVETLNCGENPTFRWYLNEGFLSSGSSTFTLPSISEGDSISCLVQTSESCLSTDKVKTIPVSIAVQPVITLTMDLPPVLFLDDAPLPLQTKPKAADISGTGVQGNVFSPAQAGTGLHRIQALTPDNPCSDTLFKEILVCDPRPTNLILRSGEAANQVWTTEKPGIVCSEKTEAEIYNRWGKVVKCFDNYQNDWNASELNPGCYFYKVQYTIPGKSSKLLRTGYFTLMP